MNNAQSTDVTPDLCGCIICLGPINRHFCAAFFVPSVLEPPVSGTCKKCMVAYKLLPIPISELFNGYEDWCE